ncbi:MAG: peptidylprolyl isomerase [Verrucomicrobiota bacterium]
MDIYKIEKLPMRPVIYGLLALYLMLDLVFLHGPLYRKLEPLIPGGETNQRMAKDGNWACTVNGEPITKEQLNLAMDVHLARRGERREQLSKSNLEYVQRAVLNDLINNKLIEQKTEFYHIHTPQEFIDARIEQFEQHFAPGQLADVCKAHELTQKQLHKLLAKHAKQQFWLEHYAREFVLEDMKANPESEAREWFDVRKEKLVVPETIRARHIFLSTVTKDSPARETQIRQLHAQLMDGAKFEKLAEQSEDERTKRSGGDLGYFSRNRMPEDFTAPVFELQPGEVGEPFRTKIGWHIVEVLERFPERPLTWEEAKPEMVAFFENEWRAFAVDFFVRERLRTEDQSKLIYFPAAYSVD